MQCKLIGKTLTKNSYNLFTQLLPYLYIIFINNLFIKQLYKLLNKMNEWNNGLNICRKGWFAQNSVNVILM